VLGEDVAVRVATVGGFGRHAPGTGGPDDQYGGGEQGGAAGKHLRFAHATPNPKPRSMSMGARDAAQHLSRGIPGGRTILAP
jgi:hypothetical protein